MLFFTLNVISYIAQLWLEMEGAPTGHRAAARGINHSSISEHYGTPNDS